ncbi:uncharacterized protein LOC135493987 [Lineus longissimus]|uniref:uncharacterized protein LOC135493987 n=1 Tax=Lineus longissimus TaxID=88925 RepID=UPI00315C56AD
MDLTVLDTHMNNNKEQSLSPSPPPPPITTTTTKATLSTTVAEALAEMIKHQPQEHPKRILRCSKCGRPYMGHSLPRGVMCTLEPDPEQLHLLQHHRQQALAVRKELRKKRDAERQTTPEAHRRKRNRLPDALTTAKRNKLAINHIEQCPPPKATLSTLDHDQRQQLKRSNTNNKMPKGYCDAPSVAVHTWVTVNP